MYMYVNMYTGPLFGGPRQPASCVTRRPCGKMAWRCSKLARLWTLGLP